MLKKLTPFAFLFLIGIQGICNTNSVKDSILKIDVEILKKASKITLKFGQQDVIKEEPFLMDIGYGKTNCLLFEIPTLKKESLNIEFKSYVSKLKLFYPIFIKLNANFEIQEEVKTKLNMVGEQLYGIYNSSTVTIDKNTKYILLTTDSNLISKDISYAYQTSNISPIYTGSTVVYVPTSRNTVDVNIQFTDIPTIQVGVPTQNNRKIFKRENGLYWGFGASFGGDKVANNPSGDDYKVGGGALFTLGYTHSLFSSNFVGRYGGGFRYQGSKDGDARNMGYVTEALITYQTKYVNIGVGGQSEFGNSIRDLSGKIYRFDAAIGPKFVLEGRFQGKMNIGLEYIMNNFTSNENQLYNGNRIGIGLKFFMGK